MNQEIKNQEIKEALMNYFTDNQNILLDDAFSVEENVYYEIECQDLFSNGFTEGCTDDEVVGLLIHAFTHEKNSRNIDLIFKVTGEVENALVVTLTTFTCFECEKVVKDVTENIKVTKH